MIHVKDTLIIIVNRAVILVSLSITVMLAGCASMSSPKSNQLKLSQDLYVTQGSEPRARHRSGETVELKGGPVLLEAPGYVGVLVVPIQKTISQLEPTLKPIEDWSGDTLEKILNLRLDELVSETNQIQVQLSSKREKEAFEKTEALQRKFPKITYLNFYRASALFMMGEREKAKAALEVALSSFPNNQEARSFYESLGGSRLANPALVNSAPKSDVKGSSNP